MQYEPEKCEEDPASWNQNVANFPPWKEVYISGLTSVAEAELARKSVPSIYRKRKLRLYSACIKCHDHDIAFPDEHVATRIHRYTAGRNDDVHECYTPNTRTIYVISFPGFYYARDINGECRYTRV